MAADWKRFAAAMGVVGESVRRVDLWRFLDCAPLSMEEFARAFCDEVVSGGGARNVLVGYSMGGRLALHALLEAARGRPGLFEAAIIVSAHPGLRGDRERLERMARDAEWAGKALAGDWEHFLREWEAQPILGVPSDEASGGSGDAEMEDRQGLLPRRQAVARSFMEWSLGKQQDLRARLAEIDCPILWVTGTRDRKFTRLAVELVPILSAGQHAEVEDAGHRVPWEQADEFARRAREFLNLPGHPIPGQ